MELLIVIILIGGAIWLIWYLVNQDKKEKAEREAKKAVESSELKVSIPGASVSKPQPSKPSSKKNPQKSSDAIYAETHNMWVCKHCETLNGSATQNCIACGTRKAS